MPDLPPNLPVRDVVPAHRFDEAKLAAWMAANVEGYQGPLKVQQFQGGASNPTFLLTDATGHLYVLRKKPPGQLLSSAHQVDREYRVMKALAGQIPVPVMRALCTDPEVIGTTFYVMDYLEGRIFRDATLPGLTPKDRSEIYDDLNATLAKLHKVDFVAAGLGDFGRHGAYFERQIARWTKQYIDAKTEEIPEMDALIEKLPARIPTDPSVSIAHGDYRLENVMYHPTENRIIAVLDWELCTIGHPLADIAYNAYLWRSHSPGWGSLDGVDFKTSGIPTEDEYVAKYCERTGRSEVPDMAFLIAFSMFRLASIGQGVYGRILAGNSARESEAINGCRATATQALAVLEGRE
ncbi:phosphotransferase [uncultured Phenylobacterium sp.]|uniref:phosphotransferase n=1 Tax=uncultured Phenylobacterium sp. TaxID=349273 RepID=UPI0025E8D032|nr:phosphotransferase [uncultured Phenylobacterium sp.]